MYPLRLGLFLLSAAAISSTSHAAPKVVTSIKPIHSLVSGVMQGVGEPSLLIEGASSPHNFNLKPSQATLLQESDIVFWIGHSLEGFLEKPLETIASGAKSVELIEAKNIIELAFRENEDFDKHDHDHDDHKEASHDDHDDHGDGANPHIWLDPQNAIHMTLAIRDALVESDAENAETYKLNATAITTKLKALETKIHAEMKPFHDGRFVVFHDAYPYFENRFDIQTTAAITINPEVAPGAKRVRELQEKIKELNVTCVFTEPQFDTKITTLVTEGLSVKIGTLDPLGSQIPAGPDQYFTMLTEMSNSFSGCLSN